MNNSIYISKFNPLNSRIPDNVQLKERLINANSKVIDGEICAVGEYRGNGKINEITSDLLSEVVANFYADKNPRPVYQGHADIMSAMAMEPKEPESIGWILGMWIEGTVLKAAIELTDFLKDEINKGYFKFTSVFVERGEDVPSNLRSLAVTNQPVVRNLAPLTLSQISENEKENNIYVSENLGDILMADKTDKTETVVEKKDDTKEVVAAPSLDDVMKLLQSIVDRLDKLEKSETEEVAEEATEDQSLAASGLVGNTESLNMALSIMTKERDTLSNELAELKKEKEQKEVKSKDVVLSNLVKEGKIGVGQKDSWAALYDKDRPLFDKLTKELKPIVFTQRFTKDNLEDSSNILSQASNQPVESEFTKNMKKEYEAMKKNILKK